MKTSPRLLAALAVALGLSAAGCGDNAALCGDGTTNVNGVCTPDGTATCGQGTIMDTGGNCVIDPNACAEGTVYIDGQCIPEDDALMADLEEGAEPNDGFQAGDGTAGMFALPAVGGDGVVIHGCINPYRDLDSNGNPDIDYDMWMVTTTGPALVEILADGVHGLDAGFVLVPGSEDDLAAAGFQRFGINLTGDTSHRQIYLPEAGTWGLVMTDSRSLFLQDGSAGGEKDCYFTTVKQVAVPTPTVATPSSEIDDMLKDKPLFYSYAPREGGLVDALHGANAVAALPSLIMMRNDTFNGYSVPDGFFTIDAELFNGGLFSTDDVLYIADPVYNYSLAPVPSFFVANEEDTFALPTDGSTVTETNHAGSFNTVADLLWGYFDVSADKVVHFDMQFEAPVDFVIADSNLNILTPSLSTGFFNGPGGDNPVTTFNDWVRFPSAGRYYFVMYASGATAGTTIDITGTVDQVTPSPIVLGTPIDNAPFNDFGATWYTLDTTGDVWIAENASATGFGGNVDIDAYDPAAFGIVDADFFPIGSRSFATDGSDTYGQIVFNAGSTTLLRVTDEAGDADSTSTVDLSVANRAFTDLGTVTQATPIDQAGISVIAGGNLFFVRGTPGDELTITVTPTGFNTSIDDLAADESNRLPRVNNGGSGVAEVLSQFVDTTGWVAFRVNKSTGNGTTFDLAIDASAPSTYTVTNGSVAFIDACATGNTLAQVDAGPFGFPGDESITDVQTMPFAFDLHGQTATEYYVSANGFLSFTPPIDDAFFINQSIPTAGTPDGLVAPLWADLAQIQICQLETANSVVIEWTGVTYGTGIPAEFEAILNDDDTIDFVYSANNTYNGSTGTVGTESLGGTVGNQVSFNTGGVAASTSKVFTPN